MDPLGFALEHFDALGRWRTIDAESKEPIDASGVLVDGTKFDGPVEFRHALMARRTEFIETVSCPVGSSSCPTASSMPRDVRRTTTNSDSIVVSAVPVASPIFARGRKTSVTRCWWRKDRPLC